MRTNPNDLSHHREPGEFKTRDGRRAVIIGKREDCTAYCWVGYVVSDLARAWTGEGIAYTYGKCPNDDIVSKWEEPVRVEGWVNVYKLGVNHVFANKSMCDYENSIAIGKRITCRHILFDGTKIIDITEGE